MGAPGIGKTRLLDATVALARGRGLRVLTARATPLEQDFPFGVARQLLEPRRHVLDAETRDEAMTGAAALAAPVVVDAVKTTLDRNHSAGDTLFAAIHGLYWTIANLAERRPILLAVDDTHWADGASLGWLAYLARRLDGMPTVLVYTVRRGDPAEADETLRALLDLRTVSIIDVPQLSALASASIVRERLGIEVDDDVSRACHSASGGNPLLLKMIADAISIDSAPSVQRVEELGGAALAPHVAARLADLSEPCRQLAEAAAVLGARASIADAAAVAGIDSLAAADAADRLVRAELLQPGPELTFIHPVFRDAVEAELGGHRRGALHARASVVLRNRGASPERPAAHLLAAPPAGDLDAAATLVAAGRDAGDRGDSELAIRFLRRALDEAPAFADRPAVVLDLGILEKAAMDPEAEAHLREALETNRGAADRTSAARALASLLTTGRRGDEAVEVLVRVQAELDSVDREASLMLLTALASLGHYVIARRHEFARYADQLRSMQLTGSTPAERWALGSLASLAAIDGDDVAVLVDLGHRALDGPPDEIRIENSGVQGALLALWAAGELREVCDRIAPMLDHALRRGAVYGAQTAWGIRGLARLTLGDLRDAEADIRAALTVGREHSYSSREPVLLATLVAALVDAGRLDEADAELTAGRLPPNWEEAWPAIPLHFAVARLRRAQGRRAVALAELRACAEQARQWSPRAVFNIAWRSELALTLDAGDASQRLADEELELAVAVGAPGPIGIATRARALLARGEERLRQLREAIEILEGSQAVLEHARTLVELGAELRRTNRRAEARDPLRLGIDIAHRCGATAVVQRGQIELHATGARPRRLVLSGVDAFTASERRVAELAADGLSNRDIAQALMVTTKTVETHLSHIFLKLGITSRADLPGELGRALTRPGVYGRQPAADAAGLEAGSLR